MNGHKVLTPSDISVAARVSPCRGIVRGCLPQEEARFGARRTMPVRRLVKAGLVRVVRAYPAPFVNDIDVS
jgi:hypothetical protein